MKVVKIGAVWCPGCLVMRPRWKEVEQENPWLETQYLDYDEDRDAVAAHAVEQGRLPAFIFFDKEGKEFLRLNGEISKDEIVSVVSTNRDR